MRPWPAVVTLEIEQGFYAIASSGVSEDRIRDLSPYIHKDDVDAPCQVVPLAIALLR